MIYAKTKDYILYHGKMQEELKNLPDNSIDSCVCDPPYDLTTMTKRWGNAKKEGEGQFGRLTKGFMGKTWDGTGVAFDPKAWAEVYRVLKPGGYLLAFGGTRTYHRMACAIEDAGFEIRDCIMWLYGSGFLKSHNIGLDVDKLNGVEIKTITKLPTNGIINYEKDEEHMGGQEIEYSTKIAQNEWQGWGTALKPAYEPIIMARKPIEESVAKNCLKYGVGGINIDECRVETNDYWGHGDKGHYENVAEGYQRKNKSMFTDKPASEINALGRFPANVITDGSEEVAMGMPDTKSNYNVDSKHNENLNIDTDIWNFGYKKRINSGFNNEGSAMRYFYSAKASKKDRDEGLDMFEDVNMRIEQNRDIHSAGCEYIENGKLKQNPHLQSSIKKNFHPTVKPVELMQYLVRLVSPKGATVLDCFCGSGSTGKAVMFENRERNANYKFIGVEMTDEYLPIIQARIEYAINKYEYDAKKEKEKTGQMNMFDFMYTLDDYIGE